MRILVYNHRCRKPERQYFEDIENKLEERVKVYRYMVQEITFPKGTIRDYFAIPASKNHYEMFHDAFADMQNSAWGQLGVCRLFPEWNDYVHMKYKTYEEHLFLDIESEKFKEGCSFEEYKQDMVRYLMLCGYKYSETMAISLVDKHINYIRDSFAKREPVANIAVDIGYMCG